MELKRDAPLTFQDRLVPKGTRLAGWAALVHGLGLAAPLKAPSAVAEGHIRGSQRTEDDWTIFDKRYWPGDTITDHLTFALRHEPIDLLILKRAFDAIPAEELTAFIKAAPTGALTRRAWFFYETADRQDTRHRGRANRHRRRGARSEGVFHGHAASIQSATASATTCSAPATTARSSAAPTALEEFLGARPCTKGRRDGRPHRRPPDRPRRELPAAGRQPRLLRDRGRAPAAQSTRTLGPRRPAGGQKSALAR